MEPITKIFKTPFQLAESFADELANKIGKAEKNNKVFTLVLSGGSTPYFLFSILTDQFSNLINWNSVHLFWGDERCVHPTHTESNYGMALHNLIEKIDIPVKNIHRIKGELNPQEEARRYSKEIIDFTLSRKGLPRFDLIILGLGEDGHTASIFPENMDLFNADKICAIAHHPVTSQTRITITGPVINNADSIVFMVTGKNKARVVSEILTKEKVTDGYPASRVDPVFGILEWYLDKEAAFYLK